MPKREPYRGSRRRSCPRPSALLAAPLAALLLVACGGPSSTPQPAETAPVAPPAAPPAATGGPASSPTAARTTGSPTGSPTAGATGTASPSTGTGALALNDVRQAWTARGQGVNSDQGPSATGFGVTPSFLAVAKGADTTALAVFVYGSQSALEQDWLFGGSFPTPKEGKNPGSFQAAWWNQNVLVLVRSRGANADEVREAFLGLGPGVAAVATATVGPGSVPATPGPAGATPATTSAPATATPTRVAAPATSTPGTAPTQPPISTPR